MILRKFMRHVTDQNWFVIGLFISIEISTLHVSADDNQTSDVDKIIAIRQASNEAIKNHNIERLFNFFDTDYIINYGSGIKILSMTEEENSWKEYFTSNPKGNYVRTPDKVYVSKSNPLAMEHGTWVGGANEDTIFSGRYSAGWRKTDGIWKIHNELFVTLMCRGSSCE